MEFCGRSLKVMESHVIFWKAMEGKKVMEGCGGLHKVIIFVS